MSSQMFDADSAQQQKRDERDTIIPLFNVDSVIDTTATRQQGEVIYKDREMITIVTPGNNMEKVNRPVKKFDREVRFKKFYDAWKAGQEIPEDGFPLVHWSLIKPSEVSMLAVKRITTVQQLAEVPEMGLPKHMPNGVALQIKAREFLQSQTDGAHVARLTTEVEDLRKQATSRNELMDELKMQVKVLTAQIQPHNPVQGPPANPEQPAPQVHIPA